jgi:nicotinamide-nucleotide amidase
LSARRFTLATAESCTGGLIAQRVTSISGSSQVFLGGVVAYDNAVKSAFVDVPDGLIQQYGAVSEPVARALAEGIRMRTRADLGLGVTGIAGPTGGTAEKPVGLVHLALASAKETQTLRINLGGDRERIRWFGSQHALVMLRRHLIS